MSRKVKRAVVFELSRLTEEQEIILGYLTYHAGRLWNQANYLVKNKLAKPHKFDLYNKLKDNSIHLRSLQSRSAQIVLEELARGWDNFFRFLENPEKFKKKGIKVVRPPKFVNPETPHRVVTWDKTGFKIEGSRVRLSISRGLRKHLLEKFGFSPEFLWIETGYKELEKLKVLNVQIVPYKSYGYVSFKLVVVYEEESPEVKAKGNKVLAIDYGKTNFATCVIEGNPTAYIIDGKGLKTLLWKKLKKIARLQSRLDNLKNKGLPTIALEKKLHKLWKSIKNLLRDYAHKVSNLVNYLRLKSQASWRFARFLRALLHRRVHAASTPIPAKSRDLEIPSISLQSPPHACTKQTGRLLELHSRPIQLFKDLVVGVHLPLLSPPLACFQLLLESVVKVTTLILLQHPFGVSGCIPALKSGVLARVFSIKELAIRNGVKTVVIGNIQESKNKESNLPAIVNQMFRLMPHGLVYRYLKYKLEPYGIEVHPPINESYTSQTDSCDESTTVSKKGKGQGRRIKRGLFLSPVKGVINADVNGARNILRKFKKGWFDLVTGLGKVVRVRIYKFNESISESLLFAGIGVCGGVNPPRGIRAG